MKAAVLYEYKQPLVIEEIDLDPPKQGEVLVRMTSSGVCHSDYHTMVGDVPWTLPVVLGHEGAGIVEEVGPGVTTVAPGDPVVLSFIPGCGKCRYCAIGRPNLCIVREKSRSLMLDGTSRLHKGSQTIYHYSWVSCFAEYAVLPEDGVIKVRKEMPMDKLCLIGCAVMTGVGAVINCAKVTPGSSVVVIGAGGIGLNVIQGATLAGAEKIIAVDVQQNKLDYAKLFGATDLVNASQVDPVKAVLDLTGGGADYAFEAIGLINTAEQALASVHRGGMAVIIGIPPSGTQMKVDPTVLREERILTGTSYGSARPRFDMPKLIDLYLAGKLKLDELVTKYYSLEEINTAYQDLLEGRLARGIIKFTG